MAAPVRTPGNPFGKNGCQLSLFTACAAPNTKIRMAAILTSTMTLLVLALSFTPRTRMYVRMSRITSDGTLNHPVGPLEAKVGFDILPGNCQPNSRVCTNQLEVKKYFNMSLK